MNPTEKAYVLASILLTVACVAFLGWLRARQPLLERAAYLEGRYGLDHSTAMEFARKE